MYHPAALSTTYATADNVNKYPTVGGTTYSYDSNKNLTGDGVWTYAYDTENHLLTASKTGTSASFVYDPMHRQSQKTVGTVKSRYVYSEWQRIADYDGVAGTLQNRYVYGTGLDEPLVQVTSGGVLTFLHADKVGSIVAVSNAAGAVANKNLFSAFGEIVTQGGTNFGFTGQRYDSELGLCYYKRRYYSPKLGRFLQTDPIGFTGEDFNLYTYVVNSPLKYVDPLGEASLVLVAGIAIGVVIAAVVAAGTIVAVHDTSIRFFPKTFPRNRLWYPNKGEVNNEGFTPQQLSAQSAYAPVTIIKVCGGLGSPLGGSGIVKYYDAETQAAIAAQRPVDTYYTEDGLYLGNSMDFVV